MALAMGWLVLEQTRCSESVGPKKGTAGRGGGGGLIKSNRQAGFKGEGWETRQDVEVEQDNGQHQGLRVGRDLGPKMEIKRVARVFGPRRKTTAKQGPDPWGFRHSKWFA